MKKLYFILLSLFLTIAAVMVPVSAGLVVTGANIDLPLRTVDSGPTNYYTLTCDPGEAISLMEFQIPIGSSVNFTIHYGSGNSMDGWIIYRGISVIQSYSEVSLGGNTYSETFYDTHVSTAIGKKVQWTSYAKNTSTDPAQTGFALYAQGYGLYSGEIAFAPVNNLPKNMITQVDFQSTDSIILKTYTEKSEKLATHISQSVGEAQVQGGSDALSVLLGSVGAFLGAIGSGLYLAKFFLMDNYVLLFSLYFFGTLSAACAKQAMRKNPDPFQIFNDWLSLQWKFLQGCIWVWQNLISMITMLVQALLKWL